MGFNLSEILTKTSGNRKEIERNMDATKGGFHPEEASIYSGLKAADQAGIMETLQKVSLRELVTKLGLKEYLGHSGALTTGTTGAAGANYLIPDKIYSELFENARCEDITPLVSNMLDTPGSYLKINVEKDGTFIPHFVASGGEAPDETLDTAQETITPRVFNINIAVTNEMIEDSLFDQMETHVRIAGKAMGEFSTKMCLFPAMDDERATATTYRVEGAYNAAGTGGAAAFAYSDVLEAEGENATDGFTTTHCIIPPIGPETLLVGVAGNPWDLEKIQAIDLKANPITSMFGIDIIRVKHMTIADVPVAVQWYSGLYTGHWHAIALNKTYGIQTVRKRWLKIENYSDPIKDLVGAVVSARQGHLIAYADAVCMISYA